MKRILFVDDEPRVLSGLQRLLRMHRHIWDLHFAVGGEAALVELANERFDVLVTDMRMPGIDGQTLLRRAHEDYPDMARIVLSGHTEVGRALNAIPLAHQYLAKPLDRDALVDVIERVCTLQSVLRSELIRDAVGGLKALPTPPRIWLELNEVLADAETAPSCLAQVIERDVALSAKVLKLANSSVFGLRRTIAAVREAVVYLGVGLLRGVLLSVVVPQGFPHDSPRMRALVDANQRHSMAVAMIARGIGVCQESLDVWFTAAMLHDVGRLVMANAIPDVFERISARARSTDACVHEIERELLGFTHAEVGAVLLGLWGVPYSIVEVVALHHRAPELPYTGFEAVHAVHVADMLAHALTDGQRGEIKAEYLQRIGLPSDGALQAAAKRALEGAAKERS